MSLFFICIFRNLNIFKIEFINVLRIVCFIVESKILLIEFIENNFLLLLMIILLIGF